MEKNRNKSNEVGDINNESTLRALYPRENKMKKITSFEHIMAADRTFPFNSQAVHYGKTLSEVRDDMRLKRLLQRAVLADAAPQSLIDSIRGKIRV